MNEPRRHQDATAPDSRADGWVVWITLAVLTVIRLVVAARSGLTEDEAYYRLWALAPTYGYYDHPPMVAWWIAAGMRIAGDNALGVRLMSVLSVIAGTLVLWRTARTMFGSVRLANRAALWLQACLMVGIGAIIITPDAPSVMFWALALWSLAELDRSRNPRWLLLTGIFAGLGLVSKYSVLFFGVSCILWFSLDRESRRWFRSPWLYLGGLLAALEFLPVVYWNANHHWASFVKQFGRVAARHFSRGYFLEFLTYGFGLLQPLIVVFCALALADWFRRRHPETRRPVLMLMCGCAPFLAYLAIHSLHDRVQANWPAPVFPALVLLACVAADDMSSPGVFRRKLRGWVAPFGIAVSIAVLLWTIHPLGRTGFKCDPTDRSRGWDDLAAVSERTMRDAGATWIATDRYGLTSLLDFHLRCSQTPVVSLTDRIRYHNLPPPDPALLRQAGLYVTLARSDRSEQLKREFSQVEKVGTWVREPRGVNLGTYVFYRIGPATTVDLTWDQLARALRPATDPED